jgi:3-hydroxyacyl-CoA dehydrogenase / enoyl-CoA hydratase / 3-hydroxybutyryl-CoA epimerase
MTNIRNEIDADGIVTLTWDMPGRSMNVLSADSIADFAKHVDAAIADPSVKGVVVTSGKPAFIAGADLSMIDGLIATAPKDDAARAKVFYDWVMQLNHGFRNIEKGGKPFVAAINGTALGGGLEVCLACHYRVCADDPSIQLGLPESKVGLMPGAGGTQRMPRLMGAMAALPLILEGRSLAPAAALKAKLIDKVVPRDQLIAEAKAAIKSGTAKSVQPWDEKGFKLPGGGPYTPAGAQVFMGGNAMLRAKTYGNYPAQDAIMSAVYEGLQVPMDAALRIEARYMTKVLMNPASGNMVRSLFLNMQAANKLTRRPKGVPETTLKKIAVLGAGMMGAGIAYVTAAAGLDVVLIDQSQDAADRGKSYSAGLFDKAIERGRGTPEQKAAHLGRITATTSYDGLKDADLVIEAVFETREIKADVTKKAAAVLPASAVFGSNTSTLPITGLAEAWAGAGRSAETFIGVHFFSPVDKMQLVEIIRGKATNDATLAVAMDYVKRIKKTPIVVNDSRGFYTSRVFSTYTGEGMRMLAEGINPALIENAGKMSGMPMPPLALSDEVALDLIHKVGTQTAKDLGAAYKPSGIEGLIETMVVKNGRLGKKAGKGFYEYPADGKKHLWAGLADFAPSGAGGRAPDQPTVDELKKRFFYAQAIETARCMEENVVTDPADADVGAILGWGFAPWTGGPLSFIDTVGVAKFVAEADSLAQKYGPRFAPNKLLRDMAAKGATFYGKSGAKAA